MIPIFALLHIIMYLQNKAQDMVVEINYESQFFMENFGYFDSGRKNVAGLTSRSFFSSYFSQLGNDDVYIMAKSLL